MLGKFIECGNIENLVLRKVRNTYILECEITKRRLLGNSRQVVSKYWHTSV